MTLKEQIPEDFKNTFLNEGEFALTCNFNGKLLKIAKSANINTEKNAAEGITMERTEIVCSDKDLEAPAPMEAVRVDGKEWFVFDVQKNIGHLVIILERRAA